MKQRITTVRDQVYEILKEDICRGLYKPGEKLQEIALAEKLNVSRSPVRDALLQLTSDGLAESIPNKGVYVRRFTAEDIAEIFDLRIMFEECAIKKISKGLSGKQKDELTSYKDRFTKEYERKDLQSYTNADTEFHMSLVNMSGNKTMIKFYTSIKFMIEQFRILSLSVEDRYEKSYSEHIGTIDCILSGDIEKAIAINNKHLEATRAEILKILS